jgi:hypothetical protein
MAGMERIPTSDTVINGQFKLEDLYDFTTASRALQPAPSRHHLYRAALDEGPCLSPGEGLQAESRRLQQCIRELLIKNQQLRMLLEPANESPLNAPITSEETNHTRDHYGSADASGK